MKKNYLRMLCESEIANTELALAVEGMSDELQRMVEKISNMKTKDLAILVKKIKYDNNIEKANTFAKAIGDKFDQLLQTISEIKSSLDDDIVKLFNNGDIEAEPDSDEEADFEKDFGDFDYDEDEESNEDEEESEDEDEDMSEAIDDLESEIKRSKKEK